MLLSCVVVNLDGLILNCEITFFLIFQYHIINAANQAEQLSSSIIIILLLFCISSSYYDFEARTCT